MVKPISADATTQEDVWIPSTCGMCYAACAIRVRRVNGVVVKIEGNPDSPQSSGRLCPKGVAGVMTLYDPNRLNTPLKRTNPEKGIGVDPGWVPISWDEALDTIADRLKKIRQDDPRKLFYSGTTILPFVHSLCRQFVTAFGSPNTLSSGGSLHCGNGAHPVGGMLHASWSIVPDFQFCNYAIYFGASKGHAAGHAANATAQMAADARARGMKLVVVDPMCNFASAKASEWLSVPPGTDGILALGMLNVLLNELGIYDAPYLQKFTNAPYLIQPDGRYRRDKASGKPLVWDSKENKARTFDDPFVGEFALEGSFIVDGVECHPAFQLLKEHVKKYTPEQAAEITTIPASTIRRIAKEFGEAARIGSTIKIEGKELPYRPAAAVFFRGAEGHSNAMQTCMAISLLNQVVGAADVPGGCMGFSPTTFGFPETGRPNLVPRPDEDGLMIASGWFLPHLPYPTHKPVPPQDLGLLDLFPLSPQSPFHVSADRKELWAKLGLSYKPEMMLNFGANNILSIGNSQVLAEVFKEIPFIVSSNIFLNEFTDFADIVLPDTSFLERYHPSSTFPFIFSHPSGLGEWSWGIFQPVVEPLPQRRNIAEVMLELAYRIGGDLPAKYHAIINRYLGDALAEPYKLAPDGRYTWEEICDRVLKSTFGEERGLEWFKKHGIVKWKKKVEEVYWRPFLKVRVPIYFEFLRGVGEEAKKIAQGAGISLDTLYYSPLPEWIPCASHRVKSPEHDLFAFYFRDTLHTDSATNENPWLDEASRMNPYTYFVSINTETARRKGIKAGDTVVLESAKGRKIKGKARLTECVHPLGVAVASSGGHWTTGQPIARGKGVHFDDLLEVDFDHIDQATLNMDTCARVKIYKE